MRRQTISKERWAKWIFLFCLLAFLPFTIAAAASVGEVSANKSKKFTLVIDAGHGGHDAGAIGAITKEKAINLNVALAFGALVERNCPDVKVIYTRKTDVFVPLHTRADIANRNKADLFISIHTNSLPKGRISRGMETYTLGMHRAADNLAVAKRENEVILYEKDYKQRYQGFDPNSSESYIMFEFIQDQNMAQSVELAKFIQRRTCVAAGRQNKGVKQAGFLVLRETSMPSCLVELGFISTRDEEHFLHSQSGVNQMSQGIYQAFTDYLRKYAPSNSVPYKAETKQEVEIPAVVPEQVREKSKESKRERRRREKAEQEAREQAEREQAAKEQAAKNAATTVTPAPDSTQQASKPVAEVPAAPATNSAATPATTPATNSAATPATPATNPATTATAPATSAATSPVAAAASEKPVFKVQVLASSTKLSQQSPRLKGESGADYYQEGGLYKYTFGASTNYNEIAQLRRRLLEKFPEAFIIAFKDGVKVDVRQAIQEFKSKK